MTEAEKMLNEYTYLKKLIKRLTDELTTEVARADYNMRVSFPTVNYGKLKEEAKTKPGTCNSKVEKDALFIIEHYEKSIEPLKAKLLDARMELDLIDRTIKHAGLTPRERLYVQLRYQEGKDLNKISREMNYSRELLFRIKKSAIQKVTAAIF